MTTTAGEPAAAREDSPERIDEGALSAYATSEDRTVFTESGNVDGWIATDLTVEPER